MTKWRWGSSENPPGDKIGATQLQGDRVAKENTTLTLVSKSDLKAKESNKTMMKALEGA